MLKAFTVRYRKRLTRGERTAANFLSAKPSKLVTPRPHSHVLQRQPHATTMSLPSLPVGGGFGGAGLAGGMGGGGTGQNAMSMEEQQQHMMIKGVRKARLLGLSTSWFFPYP